jgi:signal transduction histidine kinase
MSLDQIQQAVLRLHGQAFCEGQQDFVRAAGDPMIMPPAPRDTSPEVDALLQKVLVLAKKSGATELKQEDQKINDLASEVLTLSPELLNEFSSRATNSILTSMIDTLNSIPSSFDELCESGSMRENILNAHVAATSLCSQISLIRSLGIAIEDAANALGITAENLEHDTLAHVCMLRNTLIFANRTPNVSEVPRILNSLKHVLHVEVPFVKQVVAGTRAIATGMYEIAPHSAATIATTAASPIANRFHYGLSLNDSPIRAKRSPGSDINIYTPPNYQLFVDPNALGLVLYNLIKNSIKLASINQKPFPLVELAISPSSDGGCTSIVVSDDGVGASYDELRKYFTDRALNRLNAGESLQLTEQCLLDEAWNQHVPPFALARLILDRGASVSGGTGIGLAVASEIIGAHQGCIQLYNHPYRGAAVQILLPNVGSEVSPEERWQITLESQRHQLMKGLPTA